MCKIIDFIAGKIPVSGEKLTIALGVFDGVHPGHCAVVQSAAQMAHRQGILCGALTFVPHPREILNPDVPVNLLMPVSRRVELLLDAGADCVGIINFDRETANWEPEKFISSLCSCSSFTLAGISVGSAWRFGRNGKGDSRLLKSLCDERNIGFSAVQELTANGVKISSSTIRQAINDGDLALAGSLAQRKCTLYGKVVRGMQIAGNKLASPTANLDLAAGVMPPDGVYAGSVTLDGKTFPAVLNIGYAPTFGVAERRIEVHIIGYNGNLYDRFLAVELNGFLREIKKFSSPQDLKEQIFADIERTKILISGDK